MISNNSNVNNYHNAMKNIDIEQIPQITNPVLEVFAQHVNCAFKPKNMDLNLRSRVSELNKLDHVIEKAKNSSTFHKVMSICLLAATVSMLAAGIILALVTGNLFFTFLVAGAVISTVTAQALDENAFGKKGINGRALPVVEEAFYVVDAFLGTKGLEKQMIAKLEPLNERLEMLKKLLENHPIIRNGIQEELKQFDLTKENVNLKRIIQLKTALNELNKSVELIEKIKN